MSKDNKLFENPETVKENIEYNQQMKKIQEEVVRKFEEYRKTLAFMAADAPIEALCLPSTIEKALLAHGCLRIYDLLDCDFTKIKGLGEIRIRQLTSCLNQFFSML
jgi:hypothetical protein